MPQPDLLSKAVAGIDVSILCVEDFQLASGIQSKSVALSTLEFLEGLGIGKLSGSSLSFAAADRLKAATLCLERGCDIGMISSHLSWKDFEQLASEALKSFGYQTKTNVRFVKPRMEIDVVGVMNSLALVIDCKHWTHTNRSMISEYSRRQAVRTDRFVNSDRRIRQGVPIILTLQAEAVKFVERIPVVPIVQFRSFLQEMQAYLPEIHVVHRS